MERYRSPVALWCPPMANPESSLRAKPVRKARVPKTGQCTTNNKREDAQFYSRSHDAVIRVYDAGDNMNHLVGIYLVSAVVKVTAPAFPVCATCSRTMDMSRS